MAESVIKKSINDIKVVTQQEILPSGSNTVLVTASVPSGYKFLCWLRAATVGWVGFVYPATNDAGARFWSTNSSDTDRKIDCSFLVYK